MQFSIVLDWIGCIHPWDRSCYSPACPQPTSLALRRPGETGRATSAHTSHYSTKLEGSGAAAPSGVARVPTCTDTGAVRSYYGSASVYISVPGTFTLHIGKNGRVGATGTAPRVRVRRRYQERVLSAHGFAPRPRCVSDHLLSRCFAAGEVSSRELLNMARGRRPTPPPLPASPRASAPNP